MWMTRAQRRDRALFTDNPLWKFLLHFGINHNLPIHQGNGQIHDLPICQGDGRIQVPLEPHVTVLIQLETLEGSH